MVHSGSCLCGAVHLVVHGELGQPDACHCRSCRKQTGHYLVSVDVPRERVELEGDLTWYASSEKVRRGFCATCGSTVAWDPVAHDWIALAMGLFDTQTHTRVASHIFVSEKGDYYELTDGLPQNPR